MAERPAEAVIARGREKSLLRRHPWVYESAVARLSREPEAGGLVRVTAHDSRFLAWAAYSPRSAIRLRCWSFRKGDTIDGDWIKARIADAVAARKPLESRTNAIRLVFGEADSLPGLVADRYGEHLVCEFLSAGVERNKDLIARALMEATGCKGVFERSDSAVRAREGLPKRAGLVAGDPPPREIEVVEDGVRYGVDVRTGHKTGFYIDQRESRLRAAGIVREARERLGRGPRVLNCFSYTGGFSLAAALAGAGSVTSVDSSGEALAMARRNAGRNPGAGCRLEWVEADVFGFLRNAAEAGEKYDLVVLDPPKFAASSYHVDRAARAYKDINLYGLRLLAPGGRLLTFSCSGAVDAALFRKIVAGAVVDSGATAWIVGTMGAGADHPSLATYPEGDYLKGLDLMARP